MPRTKPGTATIELGPIADGWESVTAYEFEKFKAAHRPRVFSDATAISEPMMIRYHCHGQDGKILLVARVWLFEDYSDDDDTPYKWQPNVYEIRRDGGI